MIIKLVVEDGIRNLYFQSEWSNIDYKQSYCHFSKRIIKISSFYQQGAVPATRGHHQGDSISKRFHNSKMYAHVKFHVCFQKWMIDPIFWTEQLAKYTHSFVYWLAFTGENTMLHFIANVSEFLASKQPKTRSSEFSWILDVFIEYKE